ncbi:unnamed protein product [Parnassius apollo]|uniref:(apollo) hypothetical protein n=1 Tax=Parnassius apollo TaxID=110799 RepID=A0A8S3W0V2_PARAO|nr:unnamed protein product [Parnassius apollo]
MSSATCARSGSSLASSCRSTSTTRTPGSDTDTCVPCASTASRSPTRCVLTPEECTDCPTTGRVLSSECNCEASHMTYRRTERGCNSKLGVGFCHYSWRTVVKCSIHTLTTNENRKSYRRREHFITQLGVFKESSTS